MAYNPEKAAQEVSAYRKEARVNPLDTEEYFEDQERIENLLLQWIRPAWNYMREQGTISHLKDELVGACDPDHISSRKRSPEVIVQEIKEASGKYLNEMDRAGLEVTIGEVERFSQKYNLGVGMKLGDDPGDIWKQILEAYDERRFDTPNNLQGYPELGKE